MNPADTLSPTEITGLAAMVWTWTTAFAPRLLAAVIVLVVGLLVAGWTRRAVDRLTVRSRWVDGTVRPFLLGVVQYAIIVLMLILVLNQIGFETSSLLAVLGAAGLAVGLALQGTLSNIAAGIMLLWLRPFEVGDYIEVNGLAGTVEETGLFACSLRTFDGARLFAPNSTIWNFALRNHTQAPGRMVAINVTMASNVRREQVAAALFAALDGDDRVLRQPAPDVFVDSSTNTTLVLTCRLWTVHAAYSGLQRSIVEVIRERLTGAGLSPEGVQLVSRAVPAGPDPTRLMDL